MELIQPVTGGSLALATWVTLSFVAALFAGAKLFPGKRVLGFPQPDGARKTYVINGMSLWVATHIYLVTGTLFFGLSLRPLVTHFWSFLIVANVVAAVWSLVLMIGGRAALSPEDRRAGLGGLIKDFWYGAQLNPTLSGVDLKVFAYQPSLIGLWLLNVSFAFVQYETRGEITPQMAAYQLFWWLYLTSHYHYERGVLSMWDVIAERFGFMLVWGDLALVPFFYSIGGWWIIDDTSWVGTTAILALVTLHLLGLWIFRGANAQKDRFKRDPETLIWGQRAETLGGRLLVSGWWGVGRKINYTGEICVYFSFALCTGFQSVVPYLLPLWLCVLLPHRAWRDESRCKAKYGELWDAYTKRVRFRMIPMIY